MARWPTAKPWLDFSGSQEKSEISSIPDEIENPKQFLMQLAAKSRKREVREAIVPSPGSTASIGPDYNGKLNP